MVTDHTMSTNREMFHAKRWREDERFLTPMVTMPDNSHLFVRECIQFTHPRFGETTGLVVQFFMKVKKATLHTPTRYTRYTYITSYRKEARRCMDMWMYSLTTSSFEKWLRTVVSTICHLVW